MKKWNLIYLSPWLLISFLLVEAIWLTLFLVGLVVMPIALKMAKRETVYAPEWSAEKTITIFSNKVLDSLFGNKEDGLLPMWWAHEGGTAWTWFLRNPVCNMRFWPVVSTLPSRDVEWVGSVDEIKSDGAPGWFFARQGWYTGFWWQTKKFGVWLGYKLNPRDSKPNCPKDYRYYGLGIAAQFKRF